MSTKAVFMAVLTGACFSLVVEVRQSNCVETSNPLELNPDRGHPPDQEFTCLSRMLTPCFHGDESTY